MEDEAIIGLFWERSQDAVAFLDRKYGRLLRSIALNILGDARDAEEIVSDTYMTLWERIPLNGRSTCWPIPQDSAATRRMTECAAVFG